VFKRGVMIYTSPYTDIVHAGLNRKIKFCFLAETGFRKNVSSCSMASIMLRQNPERTTLLFGVLLQHKQLVRPERKNVSSHRL
jgi:hypothetical protein